MKKDPYKILEVNRDASQQDIKNAYRKKSKRYHPDLCKDSDATEKFKQVNWANEILSDPQKRNQYDNGIDPDSQNQGHSGGFNPFEDMMSSFFSGGHRQSRQASGEDAHAVMDISLEDIHFGRKQKIRYSRKVKCSTCNCSGSKTGKKQTCSTCSGTGRIYRVHQQGPMMFRQQAICLECAGRGHNTPNYDKCNSCSGEGLTSKVEQTEIELQPGIPNHVSIKVHGKGSQCANGRDGDLIIQINYKQHEIFNFNERGDIELEYHLTFFDAFFGKTINIKSINGKTYNINIPKNIDSTYKHIQKNAGYKVMTSHGGLMTGDLHLTFIIDSPVSLSNQQIELLKSLGQYVDIKNQKIERY